MSNITEQKRKGNKELTAFITSFGFQAEYEEETGKEDANLRYWFDRFQKDKYEALFHLGFLTRQEWFSPSILYLYQMADALIHKLSMQSDIEFTREETNIILTEEEIRNWKESVPFIIGMEYVEEQWLQALWDQMLHRFQYEIKGYDGTVAMYFAEHNSQINVAGRVFFHLVETKAEEYPFAFMATYSTKPVKSKKAIHTPLKNALVEFKKDDRQLLSLMSAVTKAAETSLLISDLMESGELFSPLKFTAKEAYEFLKEIPLYEEAGIMCRVPDWWRKKSNAIKMTVTVGEKEPAKAGLSAIMSFSPLLTMDGEKLTKQELQDFLTMAEGLVQYKGKWIEINKKKLEEALQALERVQTISEAGGVSLGEAMRMELGVMKELEAVSEEIEVQVSNGKWLRTVKEKMLNPAAIQEIKPEQTFCASLRTYQENGYQWLYTMWKMGFGACLADDMGLGKTVQMIAFLEYVRVHQGGCALLVLPASLLGNWQKEIDKFAPDLSYEILHSSFGKKAEDWQPGAQSFLTITTYGMAMRLEPLRTISWDLMILDEAQAIKNAGTKQSKRIKEIPSRMRIAMTGTPIENRLGDLWSLFDFLNQGLLGTPKEFTQMTKGLSQDISGYGRLRKMIGPFILRRVKTDKSIIADLPDKIEIKEYAALSKKQIGLYQSLVNEIGEKIEQLDGIERKGLVLASIMKFKQICNHPDQYLGQENFKANHSGKFEQLKEICETIREKRERVLVFTQFREMTEPLSELLEEVFQRTGFVLHGGTPVKKRNQMVEDFNGEEYIPYMVLSLKAGGVGLNLTAANHVVHFDRWWNPAVENQATDRAFRIGQTKNVIVHKFVTKGTIEEKIDSMIEEKQKLAGDLLADTGEKWITELDNKELMELFTLGGDA